MVEFFKFKSNFKLKEMLLLALNKLHKKGQKMTE